MTRLGQAWQGAKLAAAIVICVGLAAVATIMVGQLLFGWHP